MIEKACSAGYCLYIEANQIDLQHSISFLARTSAKASSTSPLSMNT